MIIKHFFIFYAGLGANTEQLKSMHRFLKGMDSQ